MDKKRAVELLWDSQHGGDSFTCMLYRMIAKADLGNKLLLKQSFPVEVETWLEWYHSPTEEEFFRDYLK